MEDRTKASFSHYDYQNLFHKEKTSEEFDSLPPKLKLSYTYNYDFATMCNAYLKKFYYERRQQITTVPLVEQTDDEIIIYRR